MTPTTDQRIPRASLREEWSVSSVQRLAWAMGRPAASSSAAARAGADADEPAPVTSLHAPARQARRVEALQRLATDPAATLAERSLAAARAAALLQAC
ncbi:hypothetical protein [Nocardioides sp.]|uniref:hypothetical protein n=1 Tax=Nocardioides sp. TaxID=35761 RepID=UPI002B8A1A14|nr:hypothetical protein [Nocardioides sp.]HVX54502.1 hypothetical protein [Nocardioides sp.]